LKPALLAVAEIRYLSRSPLVNTSRKVAALVEETRETGQKWEDWLFHPVEGAIQTQAPVKAGYAKMPDFMNQASWWSQQEKEFEQWIYETDTASVRVNKALGISAGPDVSEQEFLKKCQAAAEEKARAEIKKLESSQRSKETTLKNKINQQQLRVDKYEKELASRGIDTALRVGESLLKLATKRKLSGLSSSATKVRMASESKGRLEEAKRILEACQEDLKNLQEGLGIEKQAVLDKWQAQAENFDEVHLTPTKQNIRITHFGIGWIE